MASSSDPWVKEYNEASRLADDISTMIADRVSLPQSGPEIMRHTSAIRRKITILGTRLDSLESLLTRIPPKSMYVLLVLLLWLCLQWCHISFSQVWHLAVKHICTEYDQFFQFHVWRLLRIKALTFFYTWKMIVLSAAYNLYIIHSQLVLQLCGGILDMKFLHEWSNKWTDKYNSWTVEVLHFGHEACYAR